MKKLIVITLIAAGLALAALIATPEPTHACCLEYDPYTGYIYNPGSDYLTNTYGSYGSYAGNSYRSYTPCCTSYMSYVWHYDWFGSLFR